MQQLRPGQVVQLGRPASPQFVHPIRLRVIRQDPTDTADADGWTWLTGYQIDATGAAVERRTVFVRTAGIEQVTAQQ